MGKHCMEEVTEFAEARFVLEAREMLECPVHGTWPKNLSKPSPDGIEHTGRAMNFFELMESLPDFLAKCSLDVLERMCGHDRKLARDVLTRAIAEVPGTE